MGAHGLAPSPARALITASLMTRGRLGLWASLLAACGTLGGEEPENTALPTAGLLPWEHVEPPAAERVGADLRWPRLLPHGDTLALYVATQSALDPPDGPPSIERWTPADGLRFELDATLWQAPAEAGAITGMDVVYAQGALWVALTLSARPGIHLLRSKDGEALEPAGVALSPEGWELSAEPALSSPGWFRIGDELALGYLGAAGSGWSWAVAHALGDEPLVRAGDSPRFESADPSEPALLWEREGMLSARAHVETSPLGRPVWRLWYAGARRRASGALDVSTGFAASHDGLRWERSDLNPLVRRGNFGEREAHELHLDGQRYLVHAGFWKREGANRHVIRVLRGAAAP
jgi:hypothetical protein